MSAYAEWKCGMITDAEYASECRKDEYFDKYYSEHPEEWNEEEFFEDDEIDEF